jgi:hypothetical protein
MFEDKESGHITYKSLSALHIGSWAWALSAGADSVGLFGFMLGIPCDQYVVLCTTISTFFSRIVLYAAFNINAATIH